jgi:hypothetical protein
MPIAHCVSTRSGIIRSVDAAFCALVGCATPDTTARFIHADDFRSLDDWVIEAEKPASITVKEGVADIDAPAGLTLWFKPMLVGPVEIEFDAIAVSDGGPNDQVSDLNVFWMARNRDGTAPFPGQRAGKFAEYNDLLTYYVGLGGNRNTTSRFRRYIGDPVRRPLLPEHDLTAAEAMLVPNQKQKVTLTADRNTIEFKRDGQTLFRFDDAAPYTQGWFAIRTTWSHLRVSRLRIRSLSR